MLKNKTALITGASRGIGAAIALEMARNGANIAMNYFGEKSEAEQLKKLIENEKVRCEIYYCDVCDFAKTQEMVQKVIEDFSRVDILVNNAGIEMHNSTMRMSEAEFDKVIDVNLKGCWNMIRHLFAQFARNRAGTIINIASICGTNGLAGQANYSASKGGLIAMTKSIAKELAQRNVTCNAIAPGFIDTAMTSILKDESRTEFVESIPLKRIGQPEEVAHLAVFLASAGASYITGEVVRIDGGLYI